MRDKRELKKNQNMVEKEIRKIKSYVFMYVCIVFVVPFSTSVAPILRFKLEQNPPTVY